jgi:diguanylate cyclase (GGDEF)-like protein
MDPDSKQRNKDSGKLAILANWFCARSNGPVCVFDLQSQEVIAADPKTVAKVRLPISLSELLTDATIYAVKQDDAGELKSPLKNPVDLGDPQSPWHFECLVPGELGVLYLPGTARETAIGTPVVATDELTGLSVRGSLSSLLNTALSQFRLFGRHFAVLFLDIDDFKSINDKYGHLAGDEVLRSISSAIQRAIRPHDRAVRFGGDEFVMVIAGVHSPDETRRVAARISEVATRPVVWKDGLIHFTASIGAAFSVAGEVSAESILERADKAMYRAKNLGRRGLIEVD